MCSQYTPARARARVTGHTHALSSTTLYEKGIRGSGAVARPVPSILHGMSRGATRSGAHDGLAMVVSGACRTESVQVLHVVAAAATI